MIKQLFLFPLATAINLFSMTFLLILAGLCGNEELSAEIAVIQGAIVAVFMSLSGNARSLLLSDKSLKRENGVLLFRLIIVLPAALIALFLTENIIELPMLLIIGLIIRKIFEWLIEVQLASMEKSGDYAFAKKYIAVNVISLSVLAAQIPFSVDDFFYYALYIWAASPILFLLPYLYKHAWKSEGMREVRKFIPHLGSSTIIGITTYILRVLVVLFVGKTLAGQLFTAFAIGGLVSAIYTYALGPTLVLREKGGMKSKLIFFSTIFVLIGLILVLFSEQGGLSLHSAVFAQMIGISIVGGGIMLLAQHIRLQILQGQNQDVFVPDALANILFLATIPFLFYLLGVNSLNYLFLWSSILNLTFYFALYCKKGG